MKLEYVSKDIIITNGLYYTIPKGTIFVEKANLEIDFSRTPSVMRLFKENYSYFEGNKNSNAKVIDCQNPEINDILTNLGKIIRSTQNNEIISKNLEELSKKLKSRLKVTSNTLEIR